MDEQTALEIFRLKSRIAMLEALVLSGQVVLGAIPVPRDAKLFRASAKRTQASLERVAKQYELDHLSNPALHEAQRALYADEFREMIESMKALVNSTAEMYSKLFETPR